MVESDPLEPAEPDSLDSAARKFQKELNAGLIALVLLSVLDRAEGDLYGYQIAKQLQSAAPDLNVVKQGALYPALYRLEHQGLIDSEWGTSENNRRAKYYRLTATGRRRLGEETASWNRLAEAIARSLAATPQEV